MLSFYKSFLTSTKEKRIVDILMYMKSEMFSVSKEELLKLTGVSEKTILSDVEVINNISGFELIGKSERDNYIFLGTQVDFNEALRILFKESVLYKVINGIFKNDIKTSLEWSEELYISESSFKRKIKEVREPLLAFNLKLSGTPINLIGEEIDIQNFFYSFYFSSSVIHHTFELGSDVEKIYTNIKKIKEVASGVSNVEIAENEGIRRLYIFINRLQYGFSLSFRKNEVITKILNSKDYSEFYGISKKIFCENGYEYYGSYDAVYLYVLISEYVLYSMDNPSFKRPIRSDITPSKINVEKFINELNLSAEITSTEFLSEVLYEYLLNTYIVRNIVPLSPYKGREEQSIVHTYYRTLYSKILRFLEEENFFFQLGEPSEKVKEHIANELTMIMSTYFSLEITYPEISVVLPESKKMQVWVKNNIKLFIPGVDRLKFYEYYEVDEYSQSDMIIFFGNRDLSQIEHAEKIYYLPLDGERFEWEQLNNAILNKRKILLK